MTLKTKAPCFKSKFITAELARLFSQSDSEEDFEGFSEAEEENASFSSKQLNAKAVDSDDDGDIDTGFYSDDEEKPSKRRSLLVAIRFPMKSPKQEVTKKNAKEPLKDNPRSKRACRGQTRKRQQDGDEEEEGDEVLCQSLKKRDKNIQENKAMLAKLFADLDTVADLTSPSTPHKKRRVSDKLTPRKRKLAVGAVSERRNPSRKARPPENFGVELEAKGESSRKSSERRNVDVKRLVMIDNGIVKTAKRKRFRKNTKWEARPVDDITEEELNNIAYNSKDKIWDKENGSSCHQCRQKTLDTKTVCRSGFCYGSKGQFCGPCLKNRYGEHVHAVLLDPKWSCPPCRGLCNCSICRRREGRCATGILVGLARVNGHDNVHKYLESIQKDLR